MAGELVERLRIRAKARPVGAGDGGTYIVPIYGPIDAQVDREAADRIEALERENATLRAERAAIIEKAALIADEYECHLADYGGSVDAKNFYENGGD